MSHKNLKISRTQNVPLMEKKAVWFENSDFVSGTDLAIDLWKNIAVKGQKYLEPNNHPKDFRVVSQVRVATRRPSLPFLRKKEKEKRKKCRQKLPVVPWIIWIYMLMHKSEMKFHAYPFLQLLGSNYLSTEYINVVSVY